MMKKITLLFFLLAMTLGYSQTLPLDFSDPSHLFLGDASGGGPVEVSIVAEKLSVKTNGQPWDNVYIDFSTPVDLSNDAANTITLEIQSTTAADGVEHFHRINVGGPELDFSTIGKELKTVILNFGAGAPAAANRMRIFLDAGYYGPGAASTDTYLIDNISAPGVTPPTCSDGILNQDETGIDCGGSTCGPCDETPPTGFTANLGTIGAFSVELLLNATDEASANITYNVTGGATVQTTGASGVQKSLIIYGLTPETLYSFNVSASDASGNPAANNPITVEATTIADTSNECQGFTNEAIEGTFSVGINYAMSTSGTDVTFDLTILDTDKSGFNAQVYIPTATDPGPIFNMGAPVSGQSYSLTLGGQTPAADIIFFYRIEYAGGLVRSREFTYTVGEDCVTLGTNDFDLASFSLFPNPTKGSWNLKSKNVNISAIQVFDILGKSVLNLKPNASEATINGSGLKTGLYFAKITTANGVSSLKLVKE